MAHGILHDQRLQQVRVRARQAHADRAAVILHEQRIAFEAEPLRRRRDDFGDVVERVRECIGRRPIGLTKTRAQALAFRPGSASTTGMIGSFYFYTFACSAIRETVWSPCS